MELDTIPDKPQPNTEVGSYFVSNYPPFSAWHADHLPAVIDALDTPPAERRPLGLYMHVPFCRKRCKFCYFRVYTDKNARDVDVYMDALASEVALYADRAGLAGRDFEFVYFGGGTPSYLSSKQLLTLIDRINDHWSWDKAREVTFECEPGTLKQSKLETIRDIGVTRLSLGVEHFDDEILELNGRAHKSPEIFQAYAWAREVGFPNINIDLIAGMVGETEDKWKATVEQALKLDPDCLTIYQMELPHNAVFSREVKAGAESPVAGWETKRRWVAYAFEQFRQAGYVVSSAYTMVKPGPRSSFTYRDSLWRGADMVGTGVASFSHFGGVHFQNEDRWENYVERCTQGELPIARALPLTDHQRLIREMILQLKLGHIHADYFRDKFDAEIVEVFDEPFGSLLADGVAERNGDEIRLTPAGLLRVDELLHRFFEPEFRNIRYT